MKLEKVWARLIAGAVIASALISAPASADALAEAKAGMAALNRGDSATAISLFTRAIASGQLKRTDRELAHEKRGEAYLATGRKAEALADALKALALDPSDTDAAALRDKSQGAAAGPSLADTLAFIKKKIEDQGELRFQYSEYSTSDSTDHASAPHRTLYSNLNMDAQNCNITFDETEWYTEYGVEKISNTGSYIIAIASVRNVKEYGYADYLNKSKPNVIHNIAPDIYIVEILENSLAYQGGNVISLAFFVESDAISVAKAMSHAAELCRGPQKDLF